MSTQFDRVQEEIRALSNHEKAVLARNLIDELDADEDLDVEALWVAEAQRRYEAYRSGAVEAIPGEEAMERARRSLQ